MLKRCRLERVLRRRKIRSDYKKAKEHQVVFISFFLSYFFPLLLNWLKFCKCFLIAVYRLLPQWFIEIKKFCPPIKSFKSGSEAVLIVGHRGAAAHVVENTISACEAALTKYHANALEIDICLTKDKHIVLWHDWDPDDFLSVVRQAGLEPNVKYRPFVPMEGTWRKPVIDLTLNEFQEHYGYTYKRKYPRKLNAKIETLEAFFEWAVTKDAIRCIFLDCKLPEEKLTQLPVLLDKIIEMKKRYQPRFSMVVLTAFEKVMEEMRRIRPKLDYAIDTLLPYGLVLQPEAYSSVEKAAAFGNKWASAGRPTVLDFSPWTSYRRLIAYDMKRISDNNREQIVKKILSWTINNRREMRCLVKYGIPAIVTDYPERLYKVLRKTVFK